MDFWEFDVFGGLMFIPKRYGESKISSCPFCGKNSITKNSQGIPVCAGHKTEKLDDLKCVCGELLDLLEGKWGPYFRCLNCGNINFKRGLEMNQNIGEKHNKPVQLQAVNEVPKENNKPQAKKEITIRSDDLDFI